MSIQDADRAAERAVEREELLVRAIARHLPPSLEPAVLLAWEHVRDVDPPRCDPYSPCTLMVE